MKAFILLISFLIFVGCDSSEDSLSQIEQRQEDERIRIMNERIKEQERLRIKIVDEKIRQEQRQEDERMLNNQFNELNNQVDELNRKLGVVQHPICRDNVRTCYDSCSSFYRGEGAQKTDGFKKCNDRCFRHYEACMDGISLPLYIEQ